LLFCEFQFKKCTVFSDNNIVKVDVLIGCELVQKFGLSAMIESGNDYVLIGKEEDINFLINNETGFTKISQKDLEDLTNDVIGGILNTPPPRSNNFR
jgi:hypothetical protein